MRSLNRQFVFFAVAILVLAACPVQQTPLPPYQCPNVEPGRPELKNVRYETGYLQAPAGKLFYWLFWPEKNEATAPVVLWMNGGPGSSSLIGLFMENGPFRINPDLTLYKDPTSWNENAYVLYIDEPAGVGFSNEVVSPVIDQQQYADNCQAALQDLLFSKHPEIKNRDFYLFGESFAGTYIPWTAKAILETNAQGGNKINLKGIGIGDGTVDRLSTWLTMGDYAYEQGLISDSDLFYVNHVLAPECEKQTLFLRSQNTPASVPECQTILETIRAVAKNVNYYDVRRYGQYDFRPLSCYLNKKSVQQALSIQSVNWNQSNQTVFFNLVDDPLFPTANLIVDALRQKIRVLVYSGDQDLLIHSKGTMHWLTDVANGDYGDWDGRADFQNANWAQIRSNQQIIGDFRAGGQLSFFNIHGAGHLVPMDQPVVAKMMFDRFIANEDIVSVDNGK